MNLTEALLSTGLFGIVRYRDAGDIAGAVHALADGGLKAIEVTVDSPGAWEAIASGATVPGLVVGGGTVVTVEQVKRLAGIGASFIVSPGLDVEVVHAASALGLDTVTGIATGTEILAARRAGVTFAKLFPAGALGTRYLREICGPFSQERFVATGGIELDEIGDWLNAGAHAVALGSSLAGRQAPSSPADRDNLNKRAGRALDLARAATTNGANI